VASLARLLQHFCQKGHLAINKIQYRGVASRAEDLKAGDLGTQRFPRCLPSHRACCGARSSSRRRRRARYAPSGGPVASFASRAQSQKQLLAVAARESVTEAPLPIPFQPWGAHAMLSAFLGRRRERAELGGLPQEDPWSRFFSLVD